VGEMVVRGERGDAGLERGVVKSEVGFRYDDEENEEEAQGGVCDSKDGVEGLEIPIRGGRGDELGLCIEVVVGDRVVPVCETEGGDD